MIAYEEARMIALAEIGPDLALVESATVEKPYGWYFLAQSLAFVASGDREQMLLGVGGFIVERADGRIFRFGSAYPAEQWIANYERGFKYERYDLAIVSASDPARALGLLERLGMTWVAPEDAHGTVWRIPRPYTRDQLRILLHALPCRFTDQAFWHRVDVFDEIDASGCCEYELREHATDPKTRGPAGRT